MLCYQLVKKNICEDKLLHRKKRVVSAYNFCKGQNQRENIFQDAHVRRQVLVSKIVQCLGGLQLVPKNTNGKNTNVHVNIDHCISLHSSLRFQKNVVIK